MAQIFDKGNIDKIDEFLIYKISILNISNICS